MRFAVFWKMNFIFSLNVTEIPIIKTFYDNTLKIYIQKPRRETNTNNPSTPEQIRTVTSFIRQSLELRERDSSQS
jgi:hypothetical protein